MGFFDDEEEQGPKIIYVGKLAYVQQPNGARTRSPENDLPAEAAAPSAGPAPRQPLGPVTRADLEAAGATFGVGFATLEGREYPQNPDGTYEYPKPAPAPTKAPTKPKSAYENAANALAGGTKALQAGQQQPATQDQAGAPDQQGAPAAAPANYSTAVRYQPTSNPAETQVNWTANPDGSQGKAGSLLAPDIGGGRMTITPHWAAETLRTAGLVPTGNFEKDYTAAAGVQAKRNLLLAQGDSPTDVQSYFDTQNRGLSLYEQGRSANTAANQAEKGTLTGAPRSTMTLEELRKLLEPDYVPEFAEGTGDEPIIAGTDKTWTGPKPGVADFSGRDVFDWNQPDAAANWKSSPLSGSNVGDGGFGGTYSTPLGDMTLWVDPITGKSEWKPAGSAGGFGNGGSISDFQSMFQPGTKYGYNFNPYAVDPYGADAEQRFQAQTPANQMAWAAGAVKAWQRNRKASGMGMNFPNYNSVGQGLLPHFVNRSASASGGGGSAGGVGGPEAPAGMEAYYGGQQLNPRTGLPMFAGGGQLMTDEPIMGVGMMSGEPQFMAGEGGPEAISVTPMGGSMGGSRVRYQPTNTAPEVLRLLASNIGKRVRYQAPAA